MDPCHIRHNINLIQTSNTGWYGFGTLLWQLFEHKNITHQLEITSYVSQTRELNHETVWLSSLKQCTDFLLTWHVSQTPGLCSHHNHESCQHVVQLHSKPQRDNGKISHHNNIEQFLYGGRDWIFYNVLKNRCMLWQKVFSTWEYYHWISGIVWSKQHLTFQGQSVSSHCKWKGELLWVLITNFTYGSHIE